MKTIKTSTITNSCNKWFKKYGSSQILISDDGVQFTSEEFSNYLQIMKIRQILIPVYSPQSNRITERLYRTIGEILRIYKGSSFKTFLQIIGRRFNFTFNTNLRNIPILYDTTPNNENNKSDDSDIRKEEINDNVNKGNFVFIRKGVKKGKNDDIFTGPLQVEKVGAKGRWLKVAGNEN